MFQEVSYYPFYVGLPLVGLSCTRVAISEYYNWNLQVNLAEIEELDKFKNRK